MAGVAFLFPGQGSQKVGMGQALAAARPEARAVFDEADAALGFALSKLCFEGPEADLTHLIVETLALGIDLYPRAAGEALDVTGDATDQLEDSPFAALKALKPGKT